MTVSSAKRALDLFIAVPALVATSPLIGALAVLVRLDSRGPAFFAQRRVGRGRRPVRIFKLRTMVADAERHGPAVTAKGDQRITRVGRFLRRTKLDELPQLYNVVRGDMSVVGPRPEAEKYVAYYRPEWERLFEVRPGLTDEASLVFRDEEALLAASTDRERAYIEAVMPAKLQVALESVTHASLLADLRTIIRTARAVVDPGWTAAHPAVRAAAEAIARLEQKPS